MRSPDAKRGSAAVGPEILEPLQRTLGWLLSLRDPRGRIVCPEHGVEHTGKSAGAIVLALELIKHDAGADAGALREVARQQGQRLVLNLKREATSPCHTFRPGRHDPYNCSNAVIDGGACSDALAQLARELGPTLEPAELDSFRRASLVHARTYLKYAVVDKGIPAQRAWGATGLAAAWELSNEPELERTVLEAVGMLEGVQHPDGSYPYHPTEWGAGHPGASDVSSYYQSRVTAFLIHALERLGRDPRGEPFRGPLARGLDFVVALQGPDGIKCGLVEAKPWYWGATYEVASHPFDVYALARGHQLFGRVHHARAAARAFQAWVEHLDPQGRPTSHHPGPGRGRSYQCPLFWAAHAMWIARAAPELARCLALPPEPPVVGQGIDLALQVFPGAQLARLEDDAIVAWVRGARPPYNAHHGSPHGGGLLRVVRKRDGRELVGRWRLGGHQEAEWNALAGLPAPVRGWRAGKDELRFSFWLARAHRRAGRVAQAWRTPVSVFRRAVLAFAHPRASSAFPLSAELRGLEDGVELRSALAHRGGAPVSGSSLERSFRVDGEGLVVHERLVAPGAARGLDYRVPAAASEVEREGQEIRYRLA